MSTEHSVDAAFDAWVATLPAKHWAKYDISACRLGWEAQKAERIEADEGAASADGWSCIRCGAFVDVCSKCANELNESPTHPPAHAAQVAQLWEMKQRACRAHALCNELRLAHPEIPELGDDGALHEAIHDILRVDTPTAEPVAQGESPARDFTEEVSADGKPTGYVIFKATQPRSPDADSGPEDESTEQRARAWDAVVTVLEQVSPRWWDSPMNGRDCAVSAIRALAAQGQGEAVACPHHVRYPHPCRECEDGPIPDDFRPYPAHAGDKCFACGHAIGRLAQEHLVDTRDGQKVYVGSECYKKIKAAGTEGWQPPKGGPRLWLCAAASPARVPDELEQD